MLTRMHLYELDVRDKLVHYDPACAKAFYPQTEFVLPYRSTFLDR